MTKLLFLLSLILSLHSCSDSRGKKLERNDHQKLMLPKTLEVYHSDMKSIDLITSSKKYTFKIFTVVNVSCATCINKFEKWDQFSKAALKCSNAQFLPICTSDDKFELLKYLVEDKKINEVAFPLLLDHDRAFGKINNEFYNDMSGLAVLTDSENNILLKGNPIESEEDRKNFLHIICQPAK